MKTHQAANVKSQCGKLQYVGNVRHIRGVEGFDIRGRVFLAVIPLHLSLLRPEHESPLLRASDAEP